MTTIVGISGSIRRGSFNAALLRAAAACMPQGAELQMESIAAIPLYSGDEETRGIPEPVARLKDAIAAADGLLLVTPEYNNSIPGVAKNAIDWLTRPPADVPRVFRGRPVAITGASPGKYGTLLSQDAWLTVFRALRAEVWTQGRLLVSHAESVFDAEGRLTDEATRESLRKFISGFIEHVRERRLRVRGAHCRPRTAKARSRG